MKKTRLLIAAIAALAVAGALTVACSKTPEPTPEPDPTPVADYSTGVYASHLALGLEAIKDVTEVSIASCTSSPACHGGSWDAIVAKTASMWPARGQITEANPHESHASSAFECADCHALSGASVLTCWQCHEYFELPDGWEGKDPTTTIYGNTATEPMYESTVH